MAVSTNSSLSWIDYVSDSTVTDASFGTSVVNNLDFSNTRTAQISDYAQWTFGSESPDTQGVKLQFDLGESKSINFMSLLGWQGTTTPTVEFNLSSTSSHTADVFNGSPVTMPTADTGEPSHLFYPQDTTYSARYAEVIVTATSNEIVKIGRVWIGESLDLSCSIDFSLSVGDMSTKSRSRGGAAWVNSRRKLKTVNARFFGLTNNQFYGGSGVLSLLDFDYAVGQSGHCILIADGTNEASRHRLGIYGAVQQNGAIQVTTKGSGGLVTEKRISVMEDR
jgi:hypothetical protein